METIFEVFGSREHFVLKHANCATSITLLMTEWRSKFGRIFFFFFLRRTMALHDVLQFQKKYGTKIRINPGGVGDGMMEITTAGNYYPRPVMTLMGLGSSFASCVYTPSLSVTYGPEFRYWCGFPYPTTPKHHYM